MALFRKEKYTKITPRTSTVEMPGDIANKCPGCKAVLIARELEKNMRVCNKCGHHFGLKAWERIEQVTDQGSFKELNSHLVSENPLEFPEYDQKLAKAQKNSGLNEAVVTGHGTIGGMPAYVGVMAPEYMLGSMGSVVGEKLARMLDLAADHQTPAIIFTASGGARMQESIFSLFQMAKTSAALARLAEKGALYISVLTDPTTGGVTASFAMLGDINLAEPGALIGFAGPRVIEQTIKQQLPAGFQRSEFLLEHGMLDMVVHRHQMKETLAGLLKLHGGVANG
ncbi:MAG: acetyl-CoA carboxylase carboxyltransferase subunit beta [Firmicutes bacterium]|nr:acetyl-CoA carboxylase carboxyltransferase subunit beta [Bacillota bacterium]